MAVEPSDTATPDMFKKSAGGYRTGSGRKKSNNPPKTKLGWHVSTAAKANIEALALIKGCTPAEYLDELMLTAKDDAPL